MGLDDFLVKGGSFTKPSTYYNSDNIFSSSSSVYGPANKPTTVKAPQLTVDSITMDTIQKEVDKIKEKNNRKSIVIKETVQKY